MTRLTSLDGRQRRLAAIGLVCITAVILGVYVVMPQMKSYISKTASREALIEVASKGDGLAQEIAARNEAISRLTKILHGDSANLPLRQMESFLIGRLQKISWDQRVELMSVRPGHGERVDEFEEILFRVELEGGYLNLHRWLSAVRDELGFVVIKEFSLDRVGQQPLDPTLRATLTIASYRMSQS